MIIPIFPVSTTFRDEHAEAVLPRMALKLIEPPSAPVLTQQAAYQQLRLDSTLGVSPQERPDDALITTACWAATNELDARYGWLGRALMTQTWQLSLSRFPQGPVILPFPPIQSIVSVKYESALDGSDVTMTEGTDFRVGSEDDNLTYIRPLYGQRWPRIREEAGSVRITYVCGYGSDPSDVPEEIRQYAAHRLGFHYENRETSVLERGVTVQDEFGYLAGMLENLRVRGIFRPYEPATVNG